MDVLNSDFRCKWPSKNNFSELDISQSLVWQCPSLSPYFLLVEWKAPLVTLGRKNRSCRPLHKETRRRIIDRYLTGEGPKAISTAARATPGAVLLAFIVSFDIMKRSVHVRRSVKGDEVILLNFQTTLHVESIELFKLAKPRIYGWENRERLLSSRLCNRRSTGHQSVI